MRKIKIKPELLSLLTRETFKEFKINELIQAYQELPSSPQLTHKQIKQFIQRNVDRLVWAQMAIKDESSNGLYRLTNNFKPSNYEVGTPHRQPKSNDATEKTPLQGETLANLQKDLTAHKLDLLTTLSETEEYEKLCIDLPSRKEEIQDLYNNARNRYSKTLGKIKAIESLILISQEPKI